MTRKRIDENQNEVVDALRGIGASVQSLASVGKGCVDILVGFRGVNTLIEIKTVKGTWTDAELDWHMNWHGQVAVARTVDEAIAIVTGGR